MQQMGCDAIRADDFHHQVRVTLSSERDGYYGNYTPGADGIARCSERGWLFEGQVVPRTGEARGGPADALSAEQFVYCIQNHDQVGNRALGSRLHDDVGLDAHALASALLLILRMTPLLFVGQEWTASTPFQFFTDHDAELGALVTVGRQREFAHFAAVADLAQRASIPDSQSAQTFERSTLRWEERVGAPHDEMLQLYRTLLAFRHYDDVMLRPQDRAGLSAVAHADPVAVRRRSSDGTQSRLLLANFGDTSVALDSVPWYSRDMGTIVSRRLGDDGQLLPAGFVMLAGRR